MNEQIERLSDIGQGQAVSLRTDEGTTVDARAKQTVYVRDERLRLELATDESGDYDRYEVRARVESGEWTPAELRRYRPKEEDWTTLGAVVEVTPLEQYRTTKSGDMEAQEDTGTEE